MNGESFSQWKTRAERALRGLNDRGEENVPDPGATREVGGPVPEEPPPDAFPQFARYEIRGLLGEGATAVVYRAWDRELNREVAVKVQRETAFLSPIARERFRREAKTMAGIVHPNVVTVHDAGEEKGRLYLVMELVAGKPLGDWLRGAGRDEKDVVALVRKVALGVAAAHEKGIVHRDLKPANILVGESSEPKVGDFGLAHLADSETDLTKTGTALGTPLYMAPEQVEGRSKDVTPRTDVHALGAILYEGLTGSLPYSGESTRAIYERIVHGELVPPRHVNPQISKEVEWIILRALEKEPGLRYVGAAALAQDLGRFLENEPVEARPVSTLRRAGRRFRKNRRAWLTAAGFAGVVAAALWLGHAAERRAEAEREVALAALRARVRESVEDALKFRRKGHPEEMGQFLPRVRSAYDEAVRRAPRLAEIECLMGRFYRALMEDDKALEHQERALRKDRDFAPALYERAVLRAKKLGWELTREARAGTAKGAGEGDGILEDIERLLLLVQTGRSGADPFRITEAHVLAAKGIVACYRSNRTLAQGLLDQALRQDPTLEEAWEAQALAVRLEVYALKKPKEHEAAWKRVEECYSQALAHDRGYLPHWLGRATARSKIGQLRYDQRLDALAALEAAEEDYAQALKIKEGSAEAWAGRGINWSRKAYARNTQGQDPLEDCRHATSDLGRALELDRGNAQTWFHLGRTHSLAAAYRLRQAQDPLPDCARAEEAYQTANRLQPSMSDRGLTAVWHYRARYLMSRAGDPLPDLNSADDLLTKRIAAGQDGGWILIERGDVRLTRARYHEARGDAAKARQDYSLSLDDWKEAARLDPDLNAVVRQKSEEALRALKSLEPRK